MNTIVIIDTLIKRNVGIDAVVESVVITQEQTLNSRLCISNVV